MPETYSPPPHRQSNPHDYELLHELLSRQLAVKSRSKTPYAQPVALRSLDAQRNQTLYGYPRRTWLDTNLKHMEYLLFVAAVITFGAWFVDGSLRDWLTPMSRQTSPPAKVASAQAAPAPAQVGRLALPFVTDAMQQRPDEGFLASREQTIAPIPETSPLPTRLIVPAINLDTPVKQTFVVNGVWEVAEYAAGYMTGTALPGEGGNTALAGHAGLRGVVFRDLPKLVPGDDVYLDAGDWRYQFRIRGSTAVWPTQVEVLDSTPSPVLTLITCTNWDTQRLVVTAELIGSVPTPKDVQT